MSEERIAKLERVQAQHEVRFSNGREVMREIKDDVASLKPKTPEWLKLFLAGVSVVGILMAAQLWVTDRLAEKASMDQAHDLVRPLRETQDKLRDTVRSIESSQREQSTSIKAIERAQEAQSKKLDELLRGRRR